MSHSIFVKPTNKVREAIETSGVSIAEWARVNGFSSGLVYQVLEGQRKCVRGQSYRIAVALGLKDGQPLDATALSKLLIGKFTQVNQSNQEEKM